MPKRLTFLALLLLAVLAVSAFVYGSRIMDLENKSAPLPHIEPTENEPWISISSEAPQQADTVLVRVQSDAQPMGMFAGTTIDFFEAASRGWIGIVGIDAKAKPEPVIIRIALGEGVLMEKEITVHKSEWPVTELRISQELAQKGYTPQSIAKNIVQNENVIVNEATSGYLSSPYFSGKFIDPLDERIIVGAYGNIRKSGTVALQHLGADLKAKTGDPVYAINDGVVVLSAAGFPNYGTTVVIDHGLGIFSLYLHLGESKVLIGERVMRGDVIALAGNTGYSLSPHLHFSIKIQGASVDPLKFIDALNSALQ